MVYLTTDTHVTGTIIPARFSNLVSSHAQQFVTIRFTLPIPAPGVWLTVSDENGQVVELLLDSEALPEGSHNVQLDIGRL